MRFACVFRYTGITKLHYFFSPIAGHANICPNSISTKPQDLETLISTFKHEILHALGFSVSLYAFYRDKNGNAFSGSMSKLVNSSQSPSFTSDGSSIHRISRKILRKVIRPKWKVRGGAIDHAVFVISTPNVIVSLPIEILIHLAI